MKEILEIMAKLRDPQKGCPWDLAQTFETIAPFTIEEAYEVQDAIQKGTPSDILEELGDLLLQIVFYCQMAQEKKWFGFSDVAAKLKEKLIRRHPHIFADEKVGSSEEQHQLWENLKIKERQQKFNNNSVLNGIPKNLPGLMRAQKLQARAASVGFDWPSIEPVLDKLKEEVKEFEECYPIDKTAAKEELGDILFVCANLARHLKLDAESVIRDANIKFERRFNGVEERVIASEKAWEEYSLAELENYWQEVKVTEKVVE
jgi:nucleoside triphosphate diphosphatase